MQLSARILTALAVLAFVVGVAVGTKGATDDVSAATGTIDALNVGVCATTNADVFSTDNCSQPTAFYLQRELDDLIEVESLYATYAHDPITGAESPRAIIEDGDLLRISISDSGRDRRDPVLIASEQEDFDGAFDAFATDKGGLRNETDDDTGTDGDQPHDAAAIVAEELGVDVDDLPALERHAEFAISDANLNSSTFSGSNSYEIIWGRRDADETDDFKPIASAEDNGQVKFFGRVTDAAGDQGPFQDIGAYVSLDEDVISGDVDEPPLMTLNVSVPEGNLSMVELQLVYYETSGIEYIEGNDPCFDDPDNTKGDLKVDDDIARAAVQAACTSDEIGKDDISTDNEKFVLHAESDQDAADDRRYLALVETGRFTGIFQGYVRLTDADGDGAGGNGGRDDWGYPTGSATFDHANTDDDKGVNPSTAAVIGVSDGPVTITYKDTNGNNQSYEVQIDIQAPTISIDSPAHNARSDDEKPSFIGTLNDDDSGLVAESFQLDVDNTNDPEDKITLIMHVLSNVDGTGDDGTGQVRRQSEYTGFDVSHTFGVIGADIYRAADPDTLKVHKSLDADDFDDGAADGEFNGELEIDFDEFPPVSEDQDFVFNNAVDFQAIVRDLAGNVGFSDSQPTAPRFIDALEEDKLSDRDNGPTEHNVLGFFSRHVVYVDDKDPLIEMNKSVTGFYGLNSDDDPIRDRSAVMVVFDNSVNGELIDTGTFTLEYDEESGIEVIDVDVDGKLVFLKLGEELASDARPTLAISEGREVEDLAGNVLGWQEADAEAFQVRDGILPVLTLTLSGGSGTGVSTEGPSKLTNAAMDIAIESDEDITGSPRVAVVCSNIGWTEGTGDDAEEKGVGDYVDNRTGYAWDTTGESGRLCGDSLQPTDFRESSSLSRPGNNWVYAWRNASEDAEKRHLGDGELVIVVWGRDTSTYDAFDSTSDTDTDNFNFGSQTAKIVLDTTFDSPLLDSGGSVQPEPDSEVKEPRPFVYLDFAGEGTTVTITEFTMDDEDVISSLSSVGDNRFLYWPETLAFGTHKVAFDARDAADNEPSGSTSFEFDVTARDPFVIDLTAGWNAVSVPANPVDTALDAVFTDEAVDRVVGWNPLSSTGPWSIATRIDGVWTTSANFAPLTDIVVRYGYWVHSMAFVEQSVDLKGQLDRESGENPTPVGIITVPGWNFVGVVDQDGDQTEDNFGDCLQDNEDAGKECVEGSTTTASEYMPGFRQAYTWDAIANGYRVLDGGDDMIIGEGIWVFFPDGDTVAP